jgi:hypothetical protein
MADLLLGPVLRRIEGDRATIWVETAQPATVEVRTGTAAGGVTRTFSAFGHHYALVVVDDLPPAATIPYEVLLDGEVCWPRPDDPYPPPAIHTREPGTPVRVVFGSCRQSTPYSIEHYPPDALDSYAIRLVSGTAPWPSLLVLLGDQVYADETPKKIQRYLKRRRRRRPDAPATQVVDFHEYTKLYLDSWTDPEIRWLLSTVPSTMIFDDHEIIDDWNSSATWRADIARHSWWPQRIQAGLASYWVYQHLGNLLPSALADDPIYTAVTSVDDATDVLAEFGTRADRERGCYRWSYVVDLDRTRLVVLDNRAGRELEPGQRAMLPEAEWDWFAKTAVGDHDHLLVGSSLPWLMPQAIHHLEAISERLADSRRRPVAWLAERLRRGLDLEHWAAFGRSFDALSALLSQLGSGPAAPATISVLSGDVHHSYVARARFEPEATAAVYQLTCSPVHNDVPSVARPAIRVAWNRGSAQAMRACARTVGLRRPMVRWRNIAGPHFGNAVGELVLNGRSAHVTIDATRPDKSLARVASLDL